MARTRKNAGKDAGRGSSRSKRTKEACDRCRSSKGACGGGRPCGPCKKINFICQYASHRGRGHKWSPEDKIRVGAEHAAVLNEAIIKLFARVEESEGRIEGCRDEYDHLNPYQILKYLGLVDPKDVVAEKDAAPSDNASGTGTPLSTPVESCHTSPGTTLSPTLGLEDPALPLRPPAPKESPLRGFPQPADSVQTVVVDGVAGPGEFPGAADVAVADGQDGRQHSGNDVAKNDFANFGQLNLGALDRQMTNLDLDLDLGLAPGIASIGAPGALPQHDPPGDGSPLPAQGPIDSFGAYSNNAFAWPDPVFIMPNGRTLTDPARCLEQPQQQHQYGNQMAPQGQYLPADRQEYPPMFQYESAPLPHPNVFNGPNNFYYSSPQSIV